MTNQNGLNQVSNDDLRSAAGGAYIGPDGNVVNNAPKGMVGSGAPDLSKMVGTNGHGINPMVDKDGNAWGDNSMGDIYMKNPDTGDLEIYKKSGEY